MTFADIYFMIAINLTRLLLFSLAGFIIVRTVSSFKEYVKTGDWPRAAFIYTEYRQGGWEHINNNHPSSIIVNTMQLGFIGLIISWTWPLSTTPLLIIALAKYLRKEEIRKKEIARHLSENHNDK